MNKIFLTCLIIFVISTTIPDNSHGIPVSYTAEGRVNRLNQGSCDISGSMIIDDQLFTWEGIGIGQPTTLSPLVGQYQLRITNFLLNINSNQDNFSISGNTGTFYQEVMPDSSLVDNMWFLFDNGNGSWPMWIGELFTFFDQQGPLPPTGADYTKLPEIILLTALNANPPDEIFDWASFQLRLVRNPVPVPEPSTILLLVCGVLSLMAPKLTHRP